MKRLKPVFSGIFFLILLFNCTSNKPTRTDQYSNEQLKLYLKFPGYYTFNGAESKLSGFTKKTFNRHLDLIEEKPTQKVLFYARSADKPDDIPYTAIGSLFGPLDTAKIKDIGFVNRRINAQPYLHKTAVDRVRKIVSSEYMVKLDDGFFYLFAYAPINTIIENEEDVIIAQDSLNRKYGGVIGSLKR